MCADFRSSTGSPCMTHAPGHGNRETVGVAGTRWPPRCTARLLLDLMVIGDGNLPALDLGERLLDLARHRGRGVVDLRDVDAACLGVAQVDRGLQPVLQQVRREGTIPRVVVDVDAPDDLLR